MPDKPTTNSSWATIRCPHCGYEYVPAEIFMPGDLVGKPDQVIRDALGKIIYQDYEEDSEPLATECYCCDNCGKEFLVEPVITYKVKKQVEELDFSEQSVSLLDD